MSKRIEQRYRITEIAGFALFALLFAMAQDAQATPFTPDSASDFPVLQTPPPIPERIANDATQALNTIPLGLREKLDSLLVEARLGNPQALRELLTIEKLEELSRLTSESMSISLFLIFPDKYDEKSGVWLDQIVELYLNPEGSITVTDRRIDRAVTEDENPDLSGYILNLEQLRAAVTGILALDMDVKVTWRLHQYIPFDEERYRDRRYDT